MKITQEMVDGLFAKYKNLHKHGYGAGKLTKSGNYDREQVLLKYRESGKIEADEVQIAYDWLMGQNARVKKISIASPSSQAIERIIELFTDTQVSTGAVIVACIFADYPLEDIDRDGFFRFAPIVGFSEKRRQKLLGIANAQHYKKHA
jgi:hypothetical protein